jgi:hypothetical protein
MNASTPSPCPSRNLSNHRLRLWLTILLFCGPVLPLAAAPAVTNPLITPVGKAAVTTSATVTSLDGGMALERGFVFSPVATNADPIIGGTGVVKVSKSGGLGSVTVSLAVSTPALPSGLSPATSYAIKSFVRTNLATAYSAAVVFTTAASAPAVTNPLITPVGKTGITTSTTVSDLDGGKALERGFVFSPVATNADPVIDGTGVVKISRSGGLGSVTVTLAVSSPALPAGLSPATSYAIKSFIRTNLATTYSATEVFTTATSIPVVTNPLFTLVGETSARASATVTSLDGGRNLERGFVYSPVATNPNPFISGTGVVKVSNTGGLGNIGFLLSGLSPATSYAVKSFIRTSLATAYSATVVFTTDSPISFTSGLGTVTGRVITPGENQFFDFNIPDSSSVVFSGSGASGSVTWEIRDALDLVVATGAGNLSFSGPLAWGDYRLRVSNPGVSSETFSLSLDVSSPANPRPDISVGLELTTATNPNSGIDQYFPDPSPSQGVITTTTKASSRNFFFLIDNDGVLPDRIRVDGTGGDSLFKVSYMIAGKNQTASVIVGTALTGLIDSDDAPVSVVAKVEPNKANTRIQNKVLIGGKLVTVYGSESYVGNITITSLTDLDYSDTATFQLNTLP